MGQVHRKSVFADAQGYILISMFSRCGMMSMLSLAQHQTCGKIQAMGTIREMAVQEVTVQTIVKTDEI